MTDAYVIGVDMIKFGRFPDRTVPQIGAEAALLALDDCGLTIKDMQALYCGNLGQASGMVGQRMLQEIGQTGIPVVNVGWRCDGHSQRRFVWFRHHARSVCRSRHGARTQIRHYLRAVRQGIGKKPSALNA